ncbi:Rap1a/Tai family immunity protein [Burkholderia cenocepacia]|uniref:Rap1a/Tai family immunity protein n=1 Tax=Burkholderia cenocepacia TaxID=95486 RepID=UPI001B9AC3B7|nr:Rap1a/Tai family immunity protein [Burkholderia cenocepacia]MBR7942334.1 hypothetical protein [Burkholderia cenocepacia]
MKRIAIATILAITASTSNAADSAQCKRMNGYCLDEWLTSAEKVRAHDSSNPTKDLFNAALFTGAFGMYRQSVDSARSRMSAVDFSQKDKNIKLDARTAKMVRAALVREICFPPEISVETAEKVIRAYLNAHPEAWDSTGELIFSNAFTAAYACP